MIFRIYSQSASEFNRTLWFPTPTLNYIPKKLQYFLWLEILMYTFCFCVILRCVQILLKTHLIHTNFSIIIIAFWIQWIEVFIAKMINLRYQYGIIKINEISRSIWWTDNSSEMIHLENIEKIQPLYIAALLQWHYVYSLLLGVGGVVFERLAATYFINDYEKRKRRVIPTILILSTHIFSIPFSLKAIEYKIPIAIILGIVVILMIGLFFSENNRSIWIPSPTLNSDSYIALLIEIFLMIICSIVVIRCVFVLLKTRQVHLNLSLAISIIWLQWFEVALAKLFMLPYQYGFYKITDSDASISYWWTSDSSEMILVRNYESISNLYIGSFLLWHYLYSLIIGAAAIPVERIFATFFIGDYERSSRRLIVIIPFLITHLIAIPLAFSSLEYKTSLEMVIGVFILQGTYVFGSQAFVVKYNKKLQSLSINSNKYSLSRKYQISENLRVLNMIQTFVIACFVYALIAVLLFYLTVLQYFSGSFESFINHIIETLIYLNPMFLSIVIMHSNTYWSRKFWGFRKSQTVRDVKQKTSIADETDIYFRQLKNAWV
ncbi:unnamed protein product [Caenorhabditis angaria]|uniref:Uncharacterized protein n=1 Tax=Caenorhabditis angaria TaxID=860376 RepID=A0A9P1MWN9_9PELO|nr:unnamed protein product [Caenorhabditis angaria]